MRPRTAVLLLAAAFSSRALAQPLTDAFTYQGEIASAGTPATGTYDLHFTLYDNVSAGAQVGPSLCSDNLAVTDGRFTVQLDFGSVFAGQQRFLEIWIRQDSGLSCANNTGYTILGPRQPLTAAPLASYAIVAANANSATTASVASNAANLGGLAPSFYTNAANLAGTLNDARLSTNVPRLNAPSVFAAVPSFNGGTSGLSAPFTVDSTFLVPNLNADLLDGLDSSAFLTAIPAPLLLSAAASGPIVRGSNSGTGVSVMGVQGEITSGAVSGTSYGGFFTNADDTGIGVFGRTAGPSGVGVYGQTMNTSNAGATAVFGQAAALSGTNYGGHFTNASSAGAAVRGDANAVNGANYGGLFTNDSTSGTALRGEANAGSGTTYGGYFTNLSPAGTAVRGFHASGSAIGPGPTMGGDFSSISATTNTFGLRAQSNNTGTGVSAAVRAEGDGNSETMGVWATGLPTTGLSYGVLADSYSPDGAGVYAVNRSSTGSAIGLRAETSSSGGRAVLGLALATSSINYAGRFENASTSGRGVFGWASAASGTTYGILGQSGSPNGFGVMAFGDSGATGIKSFRIDHPTDPANKYLFHYSAESPEVLNIYSGKVTLDDQGEATIDLPPYFAAINKDPRYTLTAIGAPMPMLHVSREIDEGALKQGESANETTPSPRVSFRVAGGAPNAKVSWEVKAVRNDLRMRLQGAPVEHEKLGFEKGAYQHPEYYGVPAEKGLDGLGGLLSTHPRSTP